MNKFKIGDRVMVKPQSADGFLQPWRGRFNAGRIGTISDSPYKKDGYFFVRWDHRGGGIEHHWNMWIHERDLMLAIE